MSQSSHAFTCRDMSLSLTDSSVPLSIGLSPTQAVSGHKDTESTAGDFFEDSIHNGSLDLHKEMSYLGVQSSCQNWLRPKIQNFSATYLKDAVSHKSEKTGDGQMKALISSDSSGCWSLLVGISLSIPIPHPSPPLQLGPSRCAKFISSTLFPDLLLFPCKF